MFTEGGIIPPFFLARDGLMPQSTGRARAAMYRDVRAGCAPGISCTSSIRGGRISFVQEHTNDDDHGWTFRILVPYES